MHLPWCVTQGMRWVALSRECPVIYLNSVIRRCSMKTWISLGLWFTHNKLKRKDSRGRIRILRGLSNMREVLPKVGLRFNKSLRLRRESTTKSLQTFPRLTSIGCLTLYPKRQEEKTHLARNQLVPSMVRSVGTIVLLEQRIFLGVARVATRLEFALI